MSVRHALLAVLTEGTCYGYQLRTEFSRRTGAAAPLNVGQIYNTLDRLERDGLVVKGAMDDAGHVPYTITAAGTAEVRAWLAASVGVVGARDELVVKVTLALSLPDGDAREVVRIQRERSLAEADALARSRERLEAEAGEPAFARLLSVEAQEAQVHARLTWLDAAERRIGEAHATGTRPAGLAAAPRRGRPARAPAGSAD
ncbi:PadR family transcriptional regulator [Clavibacter michiganensis]|uniref:PadR family transcriptional regulator n=3 Tax=Clavibacter michiganensis subsp. insidiosus TaxID=33014 RepID=A0A0D5CH06_9MICO|nr:PadR family transcriptional regulator [Clavibacter michiganensis]AJW78943.1 PadR family transcriptional regulator [Clavibacter michiganensis subsp. insidiosus]AWF98374.1 PadR family transcriptional regulator [Clavibacter michiganensis subsp. insidiosus]AWG01425.1 PadR family transcriptional regulator [Clavibacter michiganensis subsp. insidiosus]OQJ60040.1 PadR family transcriptional regulator [Clavibacter michiganensis subsp. insidiosus]RMC88730.1 PadR family transcriptional regulator [Clav